MPRANPNDGGRWGIMGGAFDPIHYGHLILAESALRTFQLNGVLFIPNCCPPHRDNPPVASYEDRVKMTELAIVSNKNFVISRIEEEIDGPGYTLTLVQKLKRKYSNINWHLILGADNIAIFDSWFSPEKIQEMVTIVVGNRPGTEDEFEKSSWKDKIQKFEMPPIDTSSTALRESLKNGKDIKGLVPDTVLKYIIDNRLYV